MMPEAIKQRGQQTRGFYHQTADIHTLGFGVNARLEDR